MGSALFCPLCIWYNAVFLCFQESQGAKRGLQRRLEEMLQDERPIKDIVADIKHIQSKKNISEHEIVGIVSVLGCALRTICGVTLMKLKIASQSPNFTYRHHLSPSLMRYPLSTYPSLFLHSFTPTQLHVASPSPNLT